MNKDSNRFQFFTSRLSYGQAVWIASVALFYFATARLSLSLVFEPEGIAAVWPPSGIFLSAILLTQRSVRPFLVAALFFTDFIAELLTGTPVLVSTLYALELSGDAVLSSWLLFRFVGEPITFRKVRDVFWFLALAIILSNGMLSLAAAAASGLVPGTSFWTSWKWWATSTGIGNLLITPFIISWASWAKTRLGTWNPKRAVEIAVLLILLALVNFISFSYLSTSDLFSLLLPYLSFPFLLWAALRFEVRGVTSVLVILAAIAVPFVAMGRIAVFHESPLGAVMVLQFYLAIMAVPSLFLAAVMAERNHTEGALKRKEEESRRSAREHEILAKIGRVISSNINIEEVYGRFADEVSKVISFDRLSVNIIDRVAGRIAAAYAAGLPVPGRQPGDVFSLAGSTNESVVAKRSGLLVQPKNEEEIDRLLSEQRPSFKAGLRSQMAVPLISEDRVIGILSFLSKKQNAYTDADLRLAEEVGIQIAGAIFSAQLYNARLRAEEALWKSEQKFRTIFDMASDGILIADAATKKFLQGNAAICSMLGYTKEEIENLAIHDIHPPKDITHVLDEFEKQIKGEKVLAEDLPVLRKDGAIFYADITSSPVTIVGKHCLVGIFRDITARKKAEEEKAKLQDQLLQSQKMESVGRLAGGVAHDFNNMLGVILGHAEMALEKVDPAQSLHANLQEIRKAAVRSSDLTRQLLAFARKQTVSPKVLDMNGTVSGMLIMLQRLIGEDIHLAWLPGVNLWPIKIDPSQIDQVLANLCVNARDAITGVGKVTIETGNVSFDEAYCADHAGFVPGEYVLLAVSDDGCGMDNGVLSKLFEPFFTTKEVGKGTGLGLATIYGIVKQNNGFINVYSEPDQGTTFRIYLPRHIGKTEQVQTEGLQEPFMRGQEIVLVVEDEPALLDLSKLILEKQGYRVLTAGTPGEAIRLAEEYAGEIHLLITDVVMPEMNGRDLAKKILSLCPNLKRLFMSGYTSNVIAHHGVLDEGVHFIQKPFSRKDLAAKVREALDQEKANG
jgi:PAS domain S-box-containing protein